MVVRQGIGKCLTVCRKLARTRECRVVRLGAKLGVESLVSVLLLTRGM